MRRIHVIGGKNHGKTTLVCDLVRELSRRGLRVGTIKHTHHNHELDTPGKDSHAHRHSGAVAVGILSRSMNAVFWPNAVPETAEERRYDRFAAIFEACDLVIVEGDIQADAPKIEVWRARLGTKPLVKSGTTVCAVISDDPVETDRPVIPRQDLAAITNVVLETLRLPFSKGEADGHL